MIDDERNGRRVLAAVADPALLEAVSRLAGMAGFVVDPLGVERLGVPPCPLPVVLDLAAARATPRRPGSERLILVSAHEPGSDDWRLAFNVGAQRLIVLPAEQRAFVDWLQGAVASTGRARRLCVMSGRGGAGGSVLAATLALAAASSGERTLLLDLDPGGGGQELLLGLERVDGCRWNAVFERSAVDVAAVLAGLPVVAGVSVLTAAARSPVSVQADVARTFVRDGAADHDWVIADVPRRSDVAAAALSGADLVVVVVAPDVRGVASAAHLLETARSVCRDVRTVVRCPTRGQLRVSEVTAALGAPVITTWGWDRRLGQLVDAGTLPGRWRGTSVASVAAKVLDVLTVRER